MACLAVAGVESRRAAAGGSAAGAVARLVSRLRDRGFDLAVAQPGPVGPRGAGLIRPHPIRLAAWPARAGPGHPDGIQHPGELRRVAALPGCDDDRQGLLPLFTGQMDLGRQAPAGPAGPVTGRLGAHSSRRFGLQVPVPAGTSGMLMRPAHGGINVGLPADLPSRIRRLQPGDDPAQVPSRCHRRNNRYTVCHGPYRAGTSRHGAPVRKGCHFCLCINEITLEP